MDKLVSIVVPIYNVEKYIDKCIDSIINQSYNNLEIILVNDGSPDRSVEICNQYAEKDSRIKVINKDNGGLSDARNKGIDNASGDYIVFVDGDDYIEILTIEKAIQAMHEEDADIVIWSYLAEHVDKNEIVQKTEVYKSDDSTYSKNNINQINLTIDKVNLIGYAWNKMYKLDIIRNNDLYFLKGISLVEDMLFNSVALKHCDKIVFISDSLTHYMQRPRETLGAQFYENYFDLKIRAIKALSLLFEHWKIDIDDKNVILSSMGFNIVKSNIKKISTNGQFSYSKKILYLDDFIKNKNVKKIIKDFEIKTSKDRLLSFLIKNKMKNTLIFVYNKIAIDKENK